MEKGDVEVVRSLGGEAVLSATEVARRLGVTLERVRQLRRRGQLAAIPIDGGRTYVFRLVDVEALEAIRRAS